MTEPKPVYGDPRVWCEPDETGEAFDPDTQTVGWSWSFGCHITIGMVDGRLQAQAATSDADQRAGITQRTITAAQLRDYAFKLAELANLWDARQLANSVGCDRTRTCTAAQHIAVCLGLYRTDEEVRLNVLPSIAELERRQKSQRFHDAYVRAGGPS